MVRQMQHYVKKRRRHLLFKHTHCLRAIIKHLVLLCPVNFLCTKFSKNPTQTNHYPCQSFIGHLSETQWQNLLHQNMIVMRLQTTQLPFADFGVKDRNIICRSPQFFQNPHHSCFIFCGKHVRCIRHVISIIVRSCWLEMEMRSDSSCLHVRPNCRAILLSKCCFQNVLRQIFFAVHHIEDVTHMQVLQSSKIHQMPWTFLMNLIHVYILIWHDLSASMRLHPYNVHKKTIILCS